MIEKMQKALDLGGNTHTLCDVAAQVERGEARVWRDEDEKAMIVTEILDAPQAKVLRFWLAAGELEPVLALSDEVIEWGREQGCTQATLTGRKGWTKTLASRGWGEQFIVMGREI